MEKELQRILSNLFKYLRRDKKRFVEFCLEKGHQKSEIAKAMGMTSAGLSLFIKRHIKK